MFAHWFYGTAGISVHRVKAAAHRAAAELLERRLMFTVSDVQVNDESLDSLGHAAQAETSNINFVPVGQTQAYVAASYNDGSANSSSHGGNTSVSVRSLLRARVRLRPG